MVFGDPKNSCYISISVLLFIFPSGLIAFIYCCLLFALYILSGISSNVAAGSTAALRLSADSRRHMTFPTAIPKSCMSKISKAKVPCTSLPSKCTRSAEKYPPLRHDFLCDTIHRKVTACPLRLLPFNSKTPVFWLVCPPYLRYRIFGFYKRRPSHG